MNTLLLVALLSAPASAEDKKPLLQAVPTEALVNETVELKPAKGHHFNTEAPQTCAGERAWEVTPRRFRCQVTAPGKAKFVASVCDDAKTFCVQERFEVSVKGAAASAKSKSKAPPMKRSHVPEGFIDNDPKAALAAAKKDGKLLLIDFYGIWCPPCNELDEYTYPDPAFKKASADFVKVALDVDAERSFDWKARYKVGGYPTIVIADSSLREIDRKVGVLHGPAMAKWLGETKAARAEPLEAAAARVAKDGPAKDEARTRRVARWHFERVEMEKAEALLVGLKSPEAERLLWEVKAERARKQEDKDARQQALVALTSKFKQDSEFPYWAYTLATISSDAAKGLAPEVHQAVAHWSSPEFAPRSAHIPVYLAQFEAGFVGSVESTTTAKPYWDKAAALYAEHEKKSPLAAPRSAGFELAYCLSEAGRKAEATAVYERLVKAYPQEFTFNYEYATALNEDEKRDAAYPYAVKAVDTGYGDNWLRAVRLKGEIELKTGRPDEAAKTVESALAEAVLPKSADVRTYRYITQLRSLQREIAEARSKAKPEKS
ncbi:MAG: thioredoxin family protein [Proteobacteria bacterium]|nr:thioredoxin family protein [Pseudomonadota bacterium]